MTNHPNRSVAQANAGIDYRDGYAYGKKHGLVAESQVVEAIKAHPAQGRRMGVGHRFASGYFDALIDAGVWAPNTVPNTMGTPAPWAAWKLPVH